jgi:HEAT repeat protein
MEISWALRALGPNAEAAVPWLITTLRDADQFTITVALAELQRLQFDRHQLDPLLEDWSRRGQHTNVVLVVGELHVRTAVAANCLVGAMSAGAPALRRTCVFELEQLGGSGLPAVPKLTAALKDPDDGVRYGAARALQAIGSGAAAAIPALMQATNDTSVMVRRASARALRVIQGQPTE